MNYDNNRQNAHNEIDHIFKDLLPTRNMAERPAQVALCHQMLNAMLEGGIALCDAGTGIGKTYAYLAAGTVYSRFRAACGLEVHPILISTSSIALQNAARDEYLPLLSNVLTEDGMITQPLQAVIRKGKSHPRHKTGHRPRKGLWPQTAGSRLLPGIHRQRGAAHQLHRPESLLHPEDRREP